MPGASRSLLAWALGALGCLTLTPLGKAEAAEPAWGAPLRASTWEPDNFVRDVTQTTDGYLWLATKSGLQRFDGLGFTRLTGDLLPGLPDEVERVLGTRDGALWVGLASAGLLRLRDGRVQRYTGRDGLPEGRVRALQEDGAGGVWVATARGLARLRDGRARTFGAAEGLIDHDILALGRGSDGALRVETPSGIFRVKGDALALETPSTNPGSSGTWRLAQHAEAARLLSEPVPAALPRSITPIADALTDRAGHLWLATNAGVLQVVGPNIRGGFTRTPAHRIYEDREGGLWAAAWGGLLTHITRPRVRSYTAADGLGSDAPFALAQDREGDVWITSSAGVSRHEGRFVPVPGGTRPLGRSVRSIAATPDGAVWMTTLGRGLLRHDHRGLTRLSSAEGLPTDAIEVLHAGQRSGALWAGTPDGRVLRWDGTAFRVADVGLPACMSRPCRFGVRRLAEAPDGSLWIGTSAGVWRWDGTRAQNLTGAGGLPDDLILSLHVDRAGIAWVGGRHGLARIAGGRVTAYGPAQGLPRSAVVEIVEDGRGDLWIGTEHGIYRLPREGLEAVAAGRAPRLAPVRFGRKDGLDNEEVIQRFQPSGLRTRDGRIWFATVRGLAVFEPPERWSPPPLPAPLIERAVVNGQELSRVTTRLELAPGRGELAFDYTAPAFVETHRVHFRYRLEGFDDGWVEAGSRRSAFYTNLPPGHFTFRLLAYREGEETGTASTLTLPVTVRPRFHQTPAFLVAVAIALGALLFLGQRYHVGQVRMRFDAVLTERNRIARDLHDALAQVFSAIGFQLDSLTGSLDGNEVAGKRLRQARRLLAHGRLAARHVVTNLRSGGQGRRSLRDALAELPRLYDEATFMVEVLGNSTPLPETIETELQRIAEEAVSNAIAHGQARHISLELDFQGPGLELWIRDDGRGFSTDGTNGPTPAAPSGGFGLLGMRERAARVGARLEIASEPGVGTEIGVILDRRPTAEGPSA